MRKRPWARHVLGPRPLHSSVSFAIACALGACGGDVIGDPPSKPKPDALGRGQRIHDIIEPADWLNPGDADSALCEGVPDERRVTVTGVTISAIDGYDETGTGARGNFYVQDTLADPKPYSGVTVFDPSFSPPDLRLFPGDVADVSGLFIEFLGPSSGAFGECKTLPEIGGTMFFRFDGADIVPKTIPVADLKSYATARQWLGMLVRVENVRITQTAEERGGRFTAPIDVGGGITQSDQPYISNELYDIKTDGPPLEQDAVFKSVTGVVTYFYGFKLAPRSPEDFAQ